MTAGVEMLCSGRIRNGERVPIHEHESLMQFMWSIRGGMSEREMGYWLRLSQGTVHRLLTDPRTPHETTLRKIARATGVPLTEIRELARRPRGEPSPFRLPAEADQLTEPQRDLVRKLVSELLNSGGPAKVTR